MGQQFILNELKHAEKIINDNLYQLEYSTLYEDLHIVANYYYAVMQYRRPKIKELLLDLSKRRYSKFDEDISRCQKIIDTAVKKAGEYKLLQCDSITITKNEMNTIREINDKTLERLAFTLLCIAKYQLKRNSDFGGWCNANPRDIFSLAKIKNGKSKDNAGIKTGDLYLSYLYSHGLITINRDIRKWNIKVLFMDNDSEPEMTISDFRDLGYLYNAYKGDKFFACKGCGIITKVYASNDETGLCKSCLLKSKLKYIECTDCGKVFTADRRGGYQVKRCSDCQAKHKKATYKAWIRKNSKNNRETA